MIQRSKKNRILAITLITMMALFLTPFGGGQLTAQAATVYTLYPVEGTDSNIVTMAQKIADASLPGTKVSLLSSSNPQISSTGTISYGATAVTAPVSFKATKNYNSNNYSVSVVVPAKKVTVNKTVLTSAITAANTNRASVSVSTNGSDVLPTSQWVTSTVMTTYTNAIAAAQTVANNTSATQSTVDSAVTTLSAATTTFNAAKKYGTKVVTTVTVNKTTLNSAITAANTNKASVTVSTDGSTVSTTSQWVTSTVMTTYTNAIAAAQTVANNTSVTQSTVDSAVTTLASATTTFNAAKKYGTQTQTVAGISVKDYGAKGDGVTDDTYAINNTINYVYSKGGGTVIIPDGTYLVNTAVSVILKSNVKLSLSSNATLKAKSSANSYYNIVLVLDATNVDIVGGKIIGDRYNHAGTTGANGSGIAVLGSNDINISDISISDCWGDGIYIGSSWSGRNYSDGVTIERFNLSNNRRMGITVISAKNLIIRNGEASTSNGADPQSGIDLEPNNKTEYLQNILIENVTTRNNASMGLAVALTAYNGSTNVLSVTINNHIDVGSRYPTAFYRYYESSTCKITVIGGTPTVYKWY